MPTHAPGVVHRCLLPGSTPVPREPGMLQVGLDGPARALVPDHPDVRRLLAALAGARPVRVDSAVAISALGALERAGLVVEVPGTPVDDVLLARHGAGAAEREVAREQARVLVDVAGSLREEVLRLLAAVGVQVVDDAAGATVALVLAERELARERTDALLRDGTPHLVGAAHAGGFTLGPFVVPGSTACLRCVDAHLGELDPRRPIVVDQLARRPGSAPLDAVTTALVLAWAVRDLLLVVEGERPATWSATVALDVAGAPAVPTPRTWTRHPHCGCAWDAWPARLSRSPAPG